MWSWLYCWLWANSTLVSSVAIAKCYNVQIQYERCNTIWPLFLASFVKTEPANVVSGYNDVSVGFVHHDAVSIDTNFYLNKGVINKTSSTKRMEDCFTKCLANPTCLSFSHSPDVEYCVINAITQRDVSSLNDKVTPTSFTTEFKGSGFVYYEINRKFRTTYWRLSLRKIPKFRLISWCINFEERHSFRIVSGDSPEAMRKLRLSSKFPHQEIRWNFGILRSVFFSCICF